MKNRWGAAANEAYYKNSPFSEFIEKNLLFHFKIRARSILYVLRVTCGQPEKYNILAVGFWILSYESAIFW